MIKNIFERNEVLVEAGNSIEEDDVEEVRKCEICNSILNDDEDDICDNCKASIILNENIPPNFGVDL